MESFFFGKKFPLFIPVSVLRCSSCYLSTWISVFRARSYRFLQSFQNTMFVNTSVFVNTVYWTLVFKGNLHDDKAAILFRVGFLVFFLRFRVFFFLFFFMVECSLLNSSFESFCFPAVWETKYCRVVQFNLKLYIVKQIIWIDCTKQKLKRGRWRI